MFSPSESEVVGFDSTVYRTATLQDDETQTPAGGKKYDGESQTTLKNSVQMQTDSTEEDVVQNVGCVDYNVDKLASFLNRVTPGIMKELNKVEKSKAFTSYRLLGEGSVENVKGLYALSCKSAPDPNEFVISCISWSCTGNVIVLGFQAEKHEDLCSHDSFVYFYNIGLRKFDGSSPSRIISTSSCVTSLATHPYEPAIVAFGTFDGDVNFMNLQKGDVDVILDNKVSHEDVVTHAEWHTLSSQTYLFTSSLDSHILMFKVTPSIDNVTLIDRFTLYEVGADLQFGITCFGFSTKPGTFIASLEGGELLHCSVLGASARPQGSTLVKYPVIKSVYKSSEASMVVSVEFSPFDEHIFAAAFGNESLIVFSLKEDAPLYHIKTPNNIFGVSWSPSQGNALFAWGYSNKILVYNSDNGKLLTELEPDKNTSIGGDIQHVYRAAINKKSPKLIAMTTEQGISVIWEIPQYYEV